MSRRDGLFSSDTTQDILQDFLMSCWPLLVLSLGYQKVINTLRPRQNGCYFPADISKSIFHNEND